MGSSRFLFPAHSPDGLSAWKAVGRESSMSILGGYCLGNMMRARLVLDGAKQRANRAKRRQFERGSPQSPLGRPQNGPLERTTGAANWSSTDGSSRRYPVLGPPSS